MDDLKKYEPLFGSWYADRVLGEGSFGKVYALKKSDFGKEYYSALKVITIPQSQSEISSMRSEGMNDRSIIAHYEQFVAEVVSEFDLMSRFRGTSNIVSYEDHLVIPHKDSFGYDIMIRMELLTGLVKKLEQNTFSKKDVIQLGIDMCKALELCQKHNIIHRDIKPENIFVSEHGDYKLGDFGIARTIEKTTGEMSKKGTYTYMAPEIYKGEPYGSDVDIYSLGIVMYRLLNGNRTPFLPQAPAPITHSDRENALMRRMGGEMIPPPVGAEGRLAEIVMKAIEYYPKNRFISPMQMRKELENIMYTEKEGQIIYPSGDRVELPPNQYAGDKSKSMAGTNTAMDSNATAADVPFRGRGQQAYTPAAPAPGTYETKKSGAKWIVPAAIVLFVLICMGVGVWSLIAILFGGTAPDISDDGNLINTTVNSTSPGENTRGNTAGNISNTGFSAKSGDWVYYSGGDYKLYKMHADGTAKTKLSDDDSWYINVLGDWVYYSNRGDGSKLYKMHTDGMERIKINADDSVYVNVIGDWIYYSNGGDGGKLYKIRTSGTDRTKINDDSSIYINVIGDWAYYKNGDDNKLYKIRADGTDRTKISDDGGIYINVAGDWVYYINENDNNKLYKIRTGGTDRTKLSDDWYNFINVSGDWIYYTSWDENDRLYKMKTDGKEKTKLNDERTGYINIIGDWIYYCNWDDGYKYYRIRTDGTNRASIDDGGNNAPLPPNPTEPSKGNLNNFNDPKNFSNKIWYDLSNNNYIEISTGANYGVRNGYKIYISEVDTTSLDSGELYLAVGIVVSNSLDIDINIENFDFVCAAYYNDIYEDFKVADIVLNADENLITYPVTVPAKDSKGIILGFEIPYNAETVIFAYSNIWADYTGKSYVYFLTGGG